jgi:YD repeat-containing protein
VDQSLLTLLSTCAKPGLNVQVLTANYRAVLQTLTYNNTSINMIGGGRTIDVTVNDGQLDSNIATAAVNIPVNSLPVISGVGSGTFVPGQGPASAGLAGISISDPASTTLGSVIVTLTNLLDTNQETLAVNLGSTLLKSVYSTSGSTGVLTISGTASLAVYQTVLSSLVYNDAAASPNTATRYITVTAKIGSVSSVQQLARINFATLSSPVKISGTSTGAFVQGQPPVSPGTGALVLADSINRYLTGGTVTLSGGPDGGAESLAASTAGTNITAYYQANTGVLTLSGVDSVGNYQKVLRTLQYNDVAVNPTPASRTLTIVVNDGELNSAAATATVTVTPEDLGPQLSWVGGPAGVPGSFVQNGGPVNAGVSTLSVGDLQGAQLSSATATIANPLDGSFESLKANLFGIPGLSEVYNSATATLTITGTASAGVYQQILQTLQYNDLAAPPNTTTRSINIYVNDVNDVSSEVIAATVGVATAAVPPSISGVTGGTYTQGQLSANVGTSGLQLIPSGGMLSYATAVIANPQDLSDETLTVIVGNSGLNYTYNPATDMLTLTAASIPGGLASTATFQSVLSTLAYSNSSGNPSTAPRRILLSVNDGTNSSATVTSTVQVVMAPPAPSAGASYSVAASSTGITAIGGNIAVNGSLPYLVSAQVALNGSLKLTDFTTVSTAGTAIQQSYNATTNTLTLSGVDTLANYQQVLRSLSFVNPLGVPQLSNLTATVTLNNGFNSGSSVITITPPSLGVSTPNPTQETAFLQQQTTQALLPGITVSSSPQSPIKYTQGGAPVSIMSALTVQRLAGQTNTLLNEELQMSGATVSLVNPLDGASERLSANTTGTDLIAKYNSNTGVLSITGNASTLVYQQVLQSVTYQDSAAVPSSHLRYVTVQVTDSSGTNDVIPAVYLNVTPTDVPPVIGIGTGGAFMQGQGAAYVNTSGPTISDIETGYLAGATATITNPQDGGAETLSVATSGTNISAAYNGNTGVLTLTGVDTVANYQQVLQSLQFNDTAPDPNATTRIISMVVNDGQVSSAPVTTTVSVTPADTAPSLGWMGSASGTPANFVQYGGAVNVGTTLSVTDVDRALLQSATVTIDNPLDPGSESLSVNVGNSGLSATFSGNTLTITGAADAGTYQQVLQSLQYNDLASPPNTTPRVLSIVVSDANFSSNALTTTVNVARAPVPPTLAVAPPGLASDGVTLLPVVTTGATFAPGQGPVSAGLAGLVLTDPSGMLSSATVAIANRAFDGTSEALAVTVGSSGLTAKYNSTLGELTLSAAGLPNGMASVADFQAVLRTLSYNDTAASPNTATRYLLLSVNDGTLASAGGAVLLTFESGTLPTISLGATSGGAFTEGAGPVPAGTANLVLTASSSPYLTSATVSITNLQDGAAESLLVSLAGTTGLSESYNSATGVLTITGAATIATYQKVLRTLEYNDASLNPGTAARVINIVASDGLVRSAAVATTVSVTPVSSAPSVDLNGPAAGSGYSVVFTPGGAAVTVVDPANLSLSDPDHGYLTSAIVTILNPLDGASEILSPGLAASLGLSTKYIGGVLTISGMASVATYQKVLSSVTYDDSATSPNSAARQISVVVSDGTLSSLAAITEVLIGTPNAPQLGSMDRSTYSYYNAAGRLSFTVDADGYVTGNTYDGAGNLVGQTHYFTPLSSVPTGGNAASIQVAPNSFDRTTRYFYDADGRQVGTLDARGYLSQTVYNNAGQVVQTTAYAVAPTVPQSAPPGSSTASANFSTLLQWTPSTGGDQTTYTFYNGLGQVSETYQVDDYLGNGTVDGYLTSYSYDLAGNLAAKTRFAEGVFYTIGGAAPAAPTPSAQSDQTESWQYDDLNRVIQQVDAQGTITQYNYDPVTGFLDSTVTAAGQYNQLGQSDSRTTSYSYDALGRVVETYLGVANAALQLGEPAQGTQSVYDTAGRLIESIDADNNPTFYYYDNDGRLVYTVDGDGDVTGNVYDAFGDVTQITQYATPISVAGLTGGLVGSDSAFDSAIAASGFQANPLNRITANVYGDNRGLLTSTTDGMGFATAHTYDSFGEVQTTTQDVGDVPGALTRTDVYQYDADGDLQQSVVDSGGLNLTTNTEYDAFGRVTQVQDPALITTNTTYDDPLGLIVTTTDPLQNSSVTRYDIFGRLSSTTDADGNTTNYNYNYATQTTTETDALGNVSTTIDNRYGQAIETIDGNGDTTYNSYDADGNLQTSRDGAGNLTTYTYDAADLLSSSVDQNGTVTSYQYDAARRVKNTTVDPGSADPGGLNLETQFGYNAFGQVTEVTDPTGAQTQSVFDNDGRLAFTVDPLGNVTGYTYDAQGDVVSTTKYAQSLLGDVVTDASANPSNEWSNAQGFPTFTLSAQAAGFGTAGTALAIDGRDTFSTGFTVSAGQVFTISADLVNASSSYGATIGLAYQTASGAWGFLPTQYANPGMRGVQHISGTVTVPAGAVTGYVWIQINNVINPVTGAQSQTGDWYLRNADASLVGGNTSWVSQSSDPLQAVQRRLVTGSQDQTTTSVYDAAGRLAYSIDSLGYVTGYQYNNDGQVLQTTQYAIPLSAVPSDPTVAQIEGLIDSQTSAADRTTTDSYNADGLLSSSTDALQNETGYGYDANGNLTSTTELTSSGPLTTTNVYDADGRVAYSIDQLGDVTGYLYNATGQVTRTTRYSTQIPLDTLPANITADEFFDDYVETPNGTGLDYAAGNEISYNFYDGDGHLSYSVDAMGDVTYYQYNAAGQVTQTTRYANAISLSTLEAAPTLGELTGLIAPNLSVDETSDTFYDRAGRVMYTVDAAGDITGYQDNGDGEPTKVTQYATEVALPPPAGGFTLSQVQAALVGHPGTSSYNVYDQDGRLVYTVNAVGDVTGYTYNVDGEVTQTTQSATAISISKFLVNPTPQGVANLLLPNANAATDETTTQVYDTDWRLAYSIDALGDVTGYQYNAEGQVIQTTRYANTIPVAELGSSLTPATVASLLTPAPGSDEVNNNIYNLDGQLADTVDALGDVTAYQYNFNGQVTQRTQYATPVNRGTLSINAQTTSLSAPADTMAEPDEVTNYSYYANGLLESELDAGGYTQYYSYDAFGNKTVYTNQDGNMWTYQYDVLNRLILQVDPYTATYESSVQNNQISINQDSGGKQAAIETGYDAFGNVASIVDGYVQGADVFTGERATDYFYDFLNRQLVTETAATYYTDSGQSEIVAGGDGGVLTYTGTSESQDLASGLSALSAQALETQQPLNSGTFCNGLGQAIASVDAAGNFSYKIYNTAGQLEYDVDGDGNVTGYTYDAFGNQKTVTRYATPISANSNLLNAEAQIRQLLAEGATEPNIQSAQMIAVGAQQVMAGLVSSQISSTNANNRQIATQYDQLNRKTVVNLPEVLYTSFNSAGQAAVAIASPTTDYAYDAFGDLTTQSVLNNPTATTFATIWATTYYGYDLDGHQTGVIDPMGYYTANSYDAFGNLVETYQYADMLPGGVPASLPNFNSPNFQTELGEIKQPPNLSSLNNTGFDRQVDYGYDSLNRQVTQTRVNAIVASLTPDDTGVSNTLATGVTTTTGYDGVGNVTSVTDNNGNVVKTYYNARGEVIGVRQAARDIKEASDPVGTTPSVAPLTVYQYDLLGDKVEQIAYAEQAPDPSNAGALQTTVSADEVTQNLYDILGHVTETEQLDGSTPVIQTRAYDALGHVMRTALQQTVNSSNTSQALIQVTTQNQVQVFAYDADGNQTTEITEVYTPTLSTITIEGEVNDLVTAGTSAKAAIVTTTATFDAFGEQIAKSLSGDNVGYNFYYDYDANGRLWQTDQSGVDTIYEYDLQGNATNQFEVPVSQTMPVTDYAPGRVAPHSFDANDIQSALQGIVFPNNVEIQTPAIYNMDGQAVEQFTTGENGGLNAPSIEQYDRWGNVVASTDAASQQTTYYYYNDQNQLIETIQPVVTVLQDSATATAGDFTVTVGNKNPIELSYYDDLGNRIATTDGNGNTTTYLYDQAHEQVAQYTPTQVPGQALNDVDTATEYDAFGQQVVLIGAPLSEEIGGQMVNVKNLTVNSYDPLGHLIGQDVLGGANSKGMTDTMTYSADTYTYDEAGNRVTATDGDGDTTRYFYDTNNQLVLELSPLTEFGGSADASFTTQYNYNGLGNKTGETGNGGSESWEYDGFGRLIGSIDMLGNQHAYTYDGYGRLLSNTVPSAKSQPSYYLATQNLSYTYYANGETESINDNSNDSNGTQQTTYQYDADGRQTLVKIVNGVNDVLENEAIHYDFLGRVQSVVDTGEVTQNDYYDANGNRVLIQTIPASGSEQDNWYEYDAQNRIIVADGAAAPLNGAAPALGASYTIGLGSSGTLLAYDVNGYRSEAISDGSDLKYQYDALGQITTITNGTDGNNVQTNGYDEAGRLISVDTVVGEITEPKGGAPQSVGVEGTPGANINNIVQEESLYYDANGYLIDQSTSSGLDGQDTVSYSGSSGNDVNASMQATSSLAGDAGYYNNAGEATFYTETTTGGGSVSTTNFYNEGVNSLVLTSQVATASGESPGTTNYYYDAQGNLAVVVEGNPGSVAKQFFINDVQGEILNQTQITTSNPQPSQSFAYVNVSVVTKIDGPMFTFGDGGKGWPSHRWTPSAGGADGVTCA